jgi:[ribosomal protein S5]-alanine N-acetyltransferase
MGGVLHSATLALEPLAPDHAAEMFAPMSAPEIYAYTPDAPPASVAALTERYRTLARGHSADGSQRWLNWVVRLPTGQCAGYVQATIHPGHTGDFAFVFTPGLWGKGVAFEACQAALPWLAREAGVAELYATVDPRNGRSLRLLARLGFVEVPPDRYPHGDTEPGDRVFFLACSASGITAVSSPPSSSSS